MVAKQKKLNDMPECQQILMGIRDAKDVLGGKWKTYILGALYFRGKLRFMELLRQVEGIAPKMLSKELQELEINELVTRTVVSTRPITVEYEITPHGRTLQKVILEIGNWGILHRKRIFSETTSER